MRSPVFDYLDLIVDQTQHVTSGALADYIPELTAEDPDRVAVALRTSAETAKRLIDEGHRILVVDPDNTVAGFQDSTGRVIDRRTTPLPDLDTHTREQQRRHP